MLGALCLPLVGAGQGCAEAPAPADEGYPGSGNDALFRGPANHLGGVSGGFGGGLSFADYSYRLGTSTSSVPESEVEALLGARRDQIRLSADHVAALGRVMSERPAFAAWRQFFADGGRVRAYTPLGPEELAKLPPSKLVLAGEGRYIPDRLVIVARADEPAMEEFLFHEIQHYIFDRWDAAPFEAGEADHAVIRILEERRRLVQTIRQGSVPAAPIGSQAATGGPEITSARGAHLYGAWVEAAVGRLRARNETSRGVRIVSMELSSGETLLFDERGDREEPDDISAMSVRVPPHYRFGPVVYVSLADIRSFDVERLLSGGYVPEADRSAVAEFVEAHRRDWHRGRSHIFSEAEIQDLAHLSAFNAAIFEQAQKLADLIRQEPGRRLEEVMGEPRFQAAFSDFLGRYVDRMVRASGADPRRVATEVAGEVVASLPPPPG